MSIYNSLDVVTIHVTKPDYSGRLELLLRTERTQFARRDHAELTNYGNLAICRYRPDKNSQKNYSRRTWNSTTFAGPRGTWKRPIVVFLEAHGHA